MSLFVNNFSTTQMFIAVFECCLIYLITRYRFAIKNCKYEPIFQLRVCILIALKLLCGRCLFCRGCPHSGNVKVGFPHVYTGNSKSFWWENDRMECEVDVCKTTKIVVGGGSGETTMFFRRYETNEYLAWIVRIEVSTERSRRTKRPLSLSLQTSSWQITKTWAHY